MLLQFDLDVIFDNSIIVVFLMQYFYSVKPINITFI